MSAYAPPVSIRKLFGAFVALAVLFAPASAYAAERAMAVPGHDMQMMEAGHCKAPPSQSGDHDKAADKSCCISMCMAVAIAPTAPVLEKVARPAPPVFALPAFRLGYLGEIATPPPRFA